MAVLTPNYFGSPRVESVCAGASPPPSGSTATEVASSGGLVATEEFQVSADSDRSAVESGPSGGSVLRVSCSAGEGALASQI